MASRFAHARNLERSGELDKARDSYEKLLRDDPENPDFYHHLGVVADQQRRHREAQNLLSKALQLDPNNAELLNDLGYCFFLQGKLHKAESALLKATAIASSESRYGNNLGIVMGNLGRYQDALEHFRRVGSEADAQYNMAFIHASQDNVAAAKECFRLALAADPLHQKARRAMRSFDQFENDPDGFLDEARLAEDRVRYVPYVDGESASSIQLASASESVSLPRNAGTTTRDLQTRAQAMLQQRASQTTVKTRQFD